MRFIKNDLTLKILKHFDFSVYVIRFELLCVLKASKLLLYIFYLTFVQVVLLKIYTQNDLNVNLFLLEHTKQSVRKCCGMLHHQSWYVYLIFKTVIYFISLHTLMKLGARIVCSDNINGLSVISRRYLKIISCVTHETVSATFLRSSRHRVFHSRNHGESSSLFYFLPFIEKKMSRSFLYSPVIPCDSDVPCYTNKKIFTTFPLILSSVIGLCDFQMVVVQYRRIYLNVPSKVS